MNLKKGLLIFGALIILIGVIVGLLIAFLGLYQSTQELSTPQSTAVPSGDPVRYLKENWQFYDASWDKTSNTVTAVRVYDISFEDAQKVGDRVFVDDLSPESYLSQALTIAADLSSRFSMENVTVVISFRAADKQEIFSVDSLGNVSTCWATEDLS